MPRDAAAIERHAQISEQQMHKITLQIVDKKCMARDTQAFAGKPHDLIRFQMMQEERAAYRIKTVVGKGKSQRIAADTRMAVAKMRWQRGPESPAAL